MTGKDLIIYILQNNLENEPIFKDGKLLGFISVDEAALKFGVGSATIEYLCKIDALQSIKIEERLFILDFDMV